MSKPDWKDAPEWAEWVAMDDTGEWWWYEERPHSGASEWLAYGRKQKCEGYAAWNDTLERRP